MFDFLSIDPEQIQEDAIAAYEEATGQFLFAGDERRVLINTMAGLLVIALGKLNGLLNDDFPQYAEGSAHWMFSELPETSTGYPRKRPL